MNALPPTGKTELANFLESFAQTLRDQAASEQRLATAKEANRRRRANVASARDMIKAYLWQGIDAHRAVTMAEQQTGIDADILHKLTSSIADEIQRERRNRSIMQKAALGWTNAALADHFGLADKSVARIISQMRATPTPQQ